MRPHRPARTTFLSVACLTACLWPAALHSAAAGAHEAPTSTAAHHLREVDRGQIATTFYNPIMDQNADPWMTQYDGSYYLTATTGDNVTIWRSSAITNIAAGVQSIVWSPSGKEANFTDIWSPEIHHFGDHFYIYFAADQNSNNALHRDYVLISRADNPMGPYRFVGEVHDPANQWMIDPNIFSVRGHLYFLWSGWRNDQNQVQRLFIAPMSSPTQIDGPGVVISSPTYPWETSVAPINEGPVTLQHDGKTFIVYSANASWKNAYCLGLLTLVGDNPLRPDDWRKTAHPVFLSQNGVYGPGRASFVTSENGKQDWMIYHAARVNGSGWDRTIRAQPFTWNKNGTPHFGAPIPLDQAIPLPAGEVPNRVTFNPERTTTEAVTFDVTVPRAGTYGMYVRYKNATGNTTTQNLIVNGQPQLPLSIPVSGSATRRNQDSTLEIDITLPRGASTIQIDTGPLGASVPFIQLTTTSVAPY